MDCIDRGKKDNNLLAMKCGKKILNHLFLLAKEHCSMPVIRKELEKRLPPLRKRKENRNGRQSEKEIKSGLGYRSTDEAGGAIAKSKKDARDRGPNHDRDVNPYAGERKGSHGGGKRVLCSENHAQKGKGEHLKRTGKVS